MITTSFPFDPHPGRPEHSAREHARALALERGAFHDEPVTEDRPIEGHLRHACAGDRDPGTGRHRAADGTTTRAAPRAAEECGRPPAGRPQDDAAARTTSAAPVPDRPDGGRRTRAPTVDSREAVRELWVGQRVSFPYKRRRYTGVVTKLGRTRVAVAYRIATGRDRDRVRLVHAALVTPVDSS